MDIDPDAVSQNLVKFCIGVYIFLIFGSSELAPETFTASVTVLGEGSSSHSQLGCRVLSCLFLLLGEYGMWPVEAVLELKHGRPAYVL